MGGEPSRPQVVLTGVRRKGGVRCALLVLHGATTRELSAASDWSALLGDTCLLVAVNGGLRSCQAARRRPDLYVGDKDSVRTVPSRIPSIVLPRDKDYSDFAGALQEMKKRAIQIIVVAGLLGRRLDHEWSNVFTAGCSASNFAGVVSPSRRGLVVLTSKGCRAVTVPGRLVSLFTPCGRALISLRGTKWTLKRRRVPPGSLGLSNITGTALHLVVHDGVAALVFPPR